MAYSTVYDKPLKTKRVTNIPTIDGESVVQELGFVETKAYRFHWITTAELQDEIKGKEEEAADGWVLVGEVRRVPIHEALDLYNAEIQMMRYTST